MLYQKFGKRIKEKMLKNIHVAIEDRKNQITRMVKDQGIKLKLVMFRRMKNNAFYEIDGMLNFIYMSTDLKVEDEAYKKIQEKKFNFISMSYYDIKDDIKEG